MTEFLETLPPFLKYVVMTLIPWIELRGAVPWAVAEGDQVFLPIILVTNWLIFFPTYFILQWVYEHIPQGSWLHRKLESVREKAHPRVERWGLLGLALFVGLPVPGTGAYSGSCAAWLLDIEWKRAFLGVAMGVALAFGIMWAVSEGVGGLIRSM